MIGRWITGALVGAAAVAAWGWFAPPRPLLDHLAASYCDCPGPLVVARLTLKEQQRERQLLVSSISFDATAVTEEPLFIERPERMPDFLWELISARKTIEMPVTVDYVVDLEAMTPKDLVWDEPSQTLTVRRPQLQLRKPQLSGGARVAVTNGFVLWVSGAEEKLTETALAAIVANADKAARGEKPMARANTDADQSLARTFELPLRAAGHPKARVVVTS
jgi:hypothetical protein